jgi:HSP20 family protein
MAMVRSRSGRLLPSRGWDLSNVGEILNDFDRLFAEMAGSQLGSAQAQLHYPIDLYETGESLVLEMAVPGVKAEDLDVSIEGRQLTIRGRLADTDGEDRRYWVQGIPRGEFSRTVMLPTTIVADKVQAKVHSGLLILTMPKVVEAQARKIAISEG